MLPGLREGWDGSVRHRRGEGGGDAGSLMERRVILFCGSCPFSGVIAGTGRVSAGAAPAGEERLDQGDGSKGNG